MPEQSPARRRRRVRHDGLPEQSTAADLAAVTAAIGDPQEPEPTAARPRMPEAPERPASGADPAEERDLERGLRGLLGGGSSQVSVAAAMRARDAARPSDADLAAAAARLVIIHRGWQPPD
jgi:hypothetical protein